MVLYKSSLSYYFEPSGIEPTQMLVDWDWIRLHSSTFNGPKICCELADVSEVSGNIAINILPYIPKQQLLYDLQAAAHLLEDKHSLAVNVTNRKINKYVHRLLSTVFEDIMAGTGYNGWICKKAKKTVVVDPLFIDFIYYDPATDKNIVLCGRSGLFATGRVDVGTDLLLKVLDADLSGQSLLDVGCGCGVIGTIAALRNATVTMVDTDCRAVNCTRRGLKANGLQAKTYIGDGAERMSSDQYDLVVSNPPTHAGSTRLIGLFQEIIRVLRPQGRLLLVLREQLNYEKWLDRMGKVVVVGAEHGYKVLQISKRR